MTPGESVTAGRRLGEPCPDGAGAPLMVTAHLRGPVCLPSGLLSLDGLLAATVAAAYHSPGEDLDDAALEIPLERERGGRFHLATFGAGVVVRREVDWTNQRPVVDEVARFGSARLRRMDLGAGQDKGVRRPIERLHLADKRIDWWCVGDEVRVRALLEVVDGLGHKRGRGLGEVVSWQVRDVTPWGPGFPVELDGAPLRPLPLDWPGLRRDWPIVQRQDLTYPYRAAPSAAAVTAACPEPLR